MYSTARINMPYIGREQEEMRKSQQREKVTTNKKARGSGEEMRVMTEQVFLSINFVIRFFFIHKVGF